MDYSSMVEKAYERGYKAGYTDASECVSENLCDNCACQPVCSIYNATGGVPKCRYHIEVKEE